MPGLRLEGKNAIVTGAAGGIGLETTILFLREGASVVLAEKALAKAKEVVPDAVGQVKTAKCDVSKEADIKALVDSVDEWGGLDIMFNNAGIMHADDAGKSISVSCFAT
jgi:NAD(P)-dependent dehydrogenase (short-subunit alcohol dehydrogenase family)